VKDSIKIEPIQSDPGLKDRVFDALRKAVISMDIYSVKEPPKLDERKLAHMLGVSRTPVREALSRLEQEGLVRNIPRRGTFVVRKNKREIVEIIQVWAALESMAARLATIHATDNELELFRLRCEDYQADRQLDGARIDEYSENNIKFHQDIISLSKNEFLISTARLSFAHMHSIRASTIKDPDRKVQSVIDHMRIIEALLARKTATVEKLVREHALKLAEHVEKHVDYLE